MVAHVKVIWSGMDLTLATWEDANDLKSKFSYAPAWGQATFEGGEMFERRVEWY